MHPSKSHISRDGMAIFQGARCNGSRTLEPLMASCQFRRCRGHEDHPTLLPQQTSGGERTVRGLEVEMDHGLGVHEHQASHNVQRNLTAPAQHRERP